MNRFGTIVVRHIARLFVTLGYGLGSARSVVAGVRRLLRRRRGRTHVRLGHLKLIIPEDWGDLEPNRDGGWVVRNKPTNQMTQGDITWYASIAEIHVRQPGQARFPDLGPMSQQSRMIRTNSESVELILRTANGLDPRAKAEAERVFRRVRPAMRGGQLDWPPALYGRTPREAQILSETLLSKAPGIGRLKEREQ